MGDFADFHANVVSELFVVGGGLALPEQIAWLASQGITHLISAAAELDDRQQVPGLADPEVARVVRTYHVPWADDGQAKDVVAFQQALQWVSDQLNQGVASTGRLPVFYVHCAAGVHRGPLLATFLVAALSGEPADTAYARVKAAHPNADSFAVPAYAQSCRDALAAVRALVPTAASSTSEGAAADADSTATPAAAATSDSKGGKRRAGVLVGATNPADADADAGATNPADASS